MLSVTAKKRLMAEAQDQFHDGNFLNIIDENPNLMGVANGIIEICEDHAFFRQGEPEDFVTKASDTFYPEDPNFGWSSPEVKMFMDWMNKCFINTDLREYFLRMMASALRSGNSDKIAPFFTGPSGNNSKSTVKKLLESVFGCYAHTLPTELLTEKPRSSGGPNPALALAKCAKLTFVDEPSASDTIKDGIFKKIVSGAGGDTIFARLLNENGGGMKPCFLMIIICNRIPTFANPDKAIQNRFVVVPFMSEWVTDAPESEAEQYRQGRFKLDKHFEDKIPYMSSGALWTFVQKYHDYSKYGLQTPEIVKKHNERYWIETDVYLAFINESIHTAIIPNSISTENPKGLPNDNVRLLFSDVFIMFKTWYEDNYPNRKLPDRPIFKSEITQRKRLGELHSDNTWHGVQPMMASMGTGGLNNIAGF